MYVTSSPTQTTCVDALAPPPLTRSPAASGGQAPAVALYQQHRRQHCHQCGCERREGELRELQEGLWEHCRRLFFFRLCKEPGKCPIDGTGALQKAGSIAERLAGQR